MKRTQKRKHQSSTTETVMEELERVVEGLSPMETARMQDVCKRAGATNENRTIRMAAALLLQKYGIAYRE